MNFEEWTSLPIDHAQLLCLPEETTPINTLYERENWATTIVRFGSGIQMVTEVKLKIICSNRIKIYRLIQLHNLLKLTVLQNKSRKFNEWLFDPDHFAGKWHKKNMLRDFQDS